MKKIIFIATMFLISVSANSQIKNVRAIGNSIYITDSNGKEHFKDGSVYKLIGWTNTYVVVQGDMSIQMANRVIIYNSNGETTGYVNNLTEGEYVISVTPNYFIMKMWTNTQHNQQSERKFDKNGKGVY
jgi:hypothetical protein